MRALGVDHGKVRIGLALSDPTGAVATPLGVLERRRRRKRDLRRIAEIAHEKGVEVIVVGLPIEMSGEMGPRANEVEQFARALQEHSGIRVVVWDERLSSVAAERALDAMQVRSRRRREIVDEVAAAVILQGWLDAQREDGGGF